MNKFISIFVDSFQEIKSRKMFYLFGVILFFTLLFLLLIPDFKMNGKDVFKSGMISPDMIQNASAYFFNGFIGFLIFLMVFGSAWLIPSYLGKGRIELTLSKPLDRVSLISQKFVSVYLNMLMLMTLMVFIVWIVFSIRVGGFSFNFFYGLFFSYIEFFIVYSIVFFFGIVGRSALLAIAGYFILGIINSLLAGREFVYQFLEDTIWKNILDGLYYIFPKFDKLDSIIVSLMKGDGFEDFYAVWTSLLFAAVLISAAIYVFKRRDY